MSCVFVPPNKKVTLLILWSATSIVRELARNERMYATKKYFLLPYLSYLNPLGGRFECGDALIPRKRVVFHE